MEVEYHILFLIVIKLINFNVFTCLNVLGEKKKEEKSALLVRKEN